MHSHQRSFSIPRIPRSQGPTLNRNRLFARPPLDPDNPKLPKASGQLRLRDESRPRPAAAPARGPAGVRVTRPRVPCAVRGCEVREPVRGFGLSSDCLRCFTRTKHYSSLRDIVTSTHRFAYRILSAKRCDHGLAVAVTFLLQGELWRDAQKVSR